MSDFEDNDIRAQFGYLGLAELGNNLVFIAENAVIKHDKIQHSAILLLQDLIGQGKKPVLCLSSNPIYADQYCTLLYEHFNFQDFFVLTDDCRPEKNQKENVGPWPFAWFLQQMGHQNYSKNFQKKFRISVLSRHCRAHRLRLYKAIRPYVTDKDVVVANLLKENIPVEVMQSTELMNIVAELPWSNNQHFLDLGHDQIDYTSVDHAAWQACVNVTNESWYQNDLCFITEKTWKAYANKCLVVNYGSSTVPAQLERFGLEIWKPFDAELDYQDKIPVVVELFQNKHICQMYQDNTHMIEHNFHLVTSRQFAQKLCQGTVDKIKAVFKL